MLYGQKLADPALMRIRLNIVSVEERHRYHFTEQVMRGRSLLFVIILFLTPQVFAAEFPTGILKGAGFVVEKDNQRLTEKDMHAYSSSVTVVKQPDGRYQFTVVATLQRSSTTPAKNDKRVDVYRVMWDSPTTGKLLNSSSEFKDDKSSFTIGNGQLVIKSWIARNQLWETHFYSLAK